MNNENKEREEILEEETVETETEEETVEGETAESEAQEEKKEPEEDENTKYMRLMADFQNYKRRAEKDRNDSMNYAREKVMTELLAVLDNFERALDHECSDASFKEGMDMIFKQLFDTMTKIGLEEVAALGEDFDPNFHNAVMTEDTDEYESGKVSGVLQKGYSLNGKVIRPSMVKVAN